VVELLIKFPCFDRWKWFSGGAGGGTLWSGAWCLGAELSAAAVSPGRDQLIVFLPSPSPVIFSVSLIAEKL